MTTANRAYAHGRRASVAAAALLLCAGLGGCTSPSTPPPAAADAPVPAAAGGGAAVASTYDVTDIPMSNLRAALDARTVTSQQLVERYLARIETLDAHGPELHSILAVNPEASAEARRLDEERAAGHLRGPLHGLPVVIKDNIELSGPLPTTAGSLALTGNIGGREASLVARLRGAGAIVLAKTNLSEWANFRSTQSTSGWSAVGGLTRNPYAADRNACGSSSGSGAAVAASLAAGGIGTETDGSVTCPAAINGLVGLKPTLGLVSRRGVVPITSAQDTAGPMTRTVTDAALLLAAIAGSDAQDADTRDADAHRTDYVAALAVTALQGKRLGVMRFHMGYDAKTDAVFAQAVEQLRAAGATVVDLPAFPGLKQIETDELTVLLTDFRTEINGYLASTPTTVQTRTLADLIAFNAAHRAEEMPHFGQELFERAEATAGHDEAAYAKLRSGVKVAAAAALDRFLRAQKLDALIAPTTGPAWLTDLGKGDTIGGSATTLPAVAGYPHLTVPMGLVDGLPVGLSFIGTAWSDAALLAFGYAYEQRSQARKAPSLPVADGGHSGTSSTSNPSR